MQAQAGLRQIVSQLLAATNQTASPADNTKGSATSVPVSVPFVCWWNRYRILFFGVWSLDTDASSYSPGSGPAGLRRRFIADAEGFVYVARITLAQSGNPSFALTRLKFDGRDYEVWTMAGLGGFLAEGDRPGATAAFELVGDRTLRLTQKNTAGEVGRTNMWEVSADGSTLTVTTSRTNANGDPVNNVEVYNRVEN